MDGKTCLPEQAHHCIRYDRDFYAAKKEALNQAVLVVDFRKKYFMNGLIGLLLFLYPLEHPTVSRALMSGSEKRSAL